MKPTAAIVPSDNLEAFILTVRGQKVILDADLALIYGVPTKRLNEQVKRNSKRFPDDFVFQLTAAEKSELVANCDHLARLKFSPVLPLAFTEPNPFRRSAGVPPAQAVRTRCGYAGPDAGEGHCTVGRKPPARPPLPASVRRERAGRPRSNCMVPAENGAVMSANVLNSPQAVRMSVFVVRAFVKMRELLGGTGELARQLQALEAKLTARLDVHETAIVEVLQRIMDILNPPPPPPEPPRRQIGFHARPEAEPPGQAKARKR